MYKSRSTSFPPGMNSITGNDRTFLWSSYFYVWLFRTIIICDSHKLNLNNQNTPCENVVWVILVVFSGLRLLACIFIFTAHILLNFTSCLLCRYAQPCCYWEVQQKLLALFLVWKWAYTSLHSILLFNPPPPPPSTPPPHPSLPYPPKYKHAHKTILKHLHSLVSC